MGLVKELTLEQLGYRHAQMRDELQDLYERLRDRALQDIAAGRSQSEVAREAGVDRMTVRKWLGKR